MINSFIVYYRKLIDKLQNDNDLFRSLTLEVKQLIESLEFELSRYRFLKIVVIEPKNKIIGTLDFYPYDIRHAYEVGFLDAQKAMMLKNNIFDIVV